MVFRVVDAYPARQSRRTVAMASENTSYSSEGSSHMARYWSRVAIFVYWWVRCPDERGQKHDEKRGGHKQTEPCQSDTRCVIGHSVSLAVIGHQVAYLASLLLFSPGLDCGWIPRGSLSLTFIEARRSDTIWKFSYS